jgi:copper homeostasis protein
MASTVLIEACVESAEAAVAAAEAGVARVELCDNLVEGGTTPSAGTIQLAVERLGIPVFVMIRPRGGDFVYTELEFAIMWRDIEAAKQLGAAGVVLGLLQPDGTIDRDRTARLLDVAHPLPVTFHRAFDVTRDPVEALDVLMGLGVPRLLTSGQRPRAVESLPLLRTLIERAGGRLVVMVGGEITPDNAGDIARATGAAELHAHAPARFPSPMKYRSPGVPMGRAYEPEDYVRLTADTAAFRKIVNEVSDF